jgi:hypothetical protein
MGHSAHIKYYINKTGGVPMRRIIDLKVKEIVALLLSPHNGRGAQYDKGNLVLELGRRMLLSGRFKISTENRELAMNCLRRLTKSSGETGDLAKEWCKSFGISFGGPLPPIMHL